jgi:tetratricopeptide (TPR) repeat protein
VIDRAGIVREHNFGLMEKASLQSQLQRVLTAAALGEHPALQTLLLGLNHRSPLIRATAAGQLSGRSEVKAIPALEPLLKDQNPTVRPAVEAALSQLYVVAERFDDALKLDRERVKENPNDSEIHLHLAQLYRRKGLEAEAETEFDAAQTERRQRIAAGSVNPLEYNELAWFYVQNRIKAKDALQLAENASAMAPGDPLIRDTLGWAYQRNGQFEAALAAFSAVITNQANANPLAIASSWSGVLELARAAGTPASSDAFEKFAASLAIALPADPTSQVRLNLARAAFCEQHGDRAQAATLRARAGFLDEQRWHVLGPFQNGDAPACGQAFLDETVNPIDTTATYAGLTGSVQWHPAQDGIPDGQVDLVRIFGPREHATAYAMAVVNASAEQAIELRVGSDDQVKIWLNGHEVLAVTELRQLVMDQNVVPATLKPGANTVLVKICNERVDWGFSLRLTAPGGVPLTNVEF